MNKSKKFLGRNHELKLLQGLRKKNTSSFVTITGRRRIGKSSLIREFAKSASAFFEFQGLYPNKGITRENQLAEFAEDLAKQIDAPRMQFENWTQAFTELARRTKDLDCVILIDEISWMSHGDPLFSAQLQKVWNTEFIKNKRVIFVACGSVSSWIEENILNNANFVGRVSLEINLQELSLNEASHFWDDYGGEHISSYEKLKILSITGGVPKYLEELVAKESSEKIILKKCFDESGFLFNDFDKVFSEIYMRKALGLERIVRKLAQRKYQPKDLAHILGLELNSAFSKQISLLELSGFCERNFSYLPSGESSKISQLRLKDNYLKFYIKYIEPVKQKIISKNLRVKSLDQIFNWDSVLGLHFENVILNSKSSIYPLIEMDESDIVSASPYLQKKTTRTKGATQVDLLIHTKRDLFFICEFKCVRQIDKGIIKEMKKKMDVINLPKRASLRPVLIYEGQIHPNDEAEIKKFFDTTIHLSQLM